MNRDHFDALTRNLAATASRRGLLAQLGTGVLAATPLAFGGEDAAAKRCPPCRKKRKGKCKRKLPNGRRCGNGGRCRNGHCDHNVCTLDCTGTPGPQACGPAGSGCHCVNVGDGVGACVKPQQVGLCTEAVCDPGQVCGIPCTTYSPSCWAPCV